jgi:hypothetical protein
MPLRTISLFFLISFSFSLNLISQRVDTTTFRMNTRLSYYSTEKTGEIVVHIPYKFISVNIEITLTVNGKELMKWKGVPGSKLLRLPFTLDMDRGTYTLTANIRSSAGNYYITKSSLLLLDYKPNEVKTDCLTGGLKVNGRIFFPFGFYCYSPVDPVLPEEEVVKGFNMISPYQKILPETLKERKAYMDRCAQLGVKVHYNLLSVSGGGGVSSKIDGITEAEKRQRLISEIKTFMDHPALLAWYISDEPNGYKIPPEQLEEIYKTVRTTDPWHPVSVVFMAPFLASKKYADALDIVMADPYPVPNGSVNQAGNVVKQLAEEFNGRKPVWLVPQAFGGGEWWEREPTIQEIRNMTYQALINGARGIQYFVRHGPNSFPKSTATWNECGKIAMEVAEMTPWLIYDEKAAPVRSSNANIIVWSGSYNNKLIIIAVNKLNTPQNTVITIFGKSESKARVLFENRNISINSGTISDHLSALGTQVYLIDIRKSSEKMVPFRDNLIKDAGFEDLSSPGIPSACYAWNEGDRGSTFFLDSREHYEGTHSLRMITPSENKGTRLRFFPFRVEPGRTYMVSVMAKTDSVAPDKSDRPCFELGLGDFGRERFCPDKSWKQFVTFVTIPADSILSPRVNAILRMPGKGTAWFDMIQVIEAAEIRRSIDPAVKDFWLKKLD